MAERVVFIVIEGDTEVAFYKNIIKVLNEKTEIECKIEYINAKGIGNFKKDVCRKFRTIIKEKYPNYIYDIVLCYDTDAFEFSRIPAVNLDKVSESLQDAGANSVSLVPAKHSIEDWFLYDFDGIRKYLRLPKNAKKPKGDNGYNILKHLFKSKGKIYIKGSNSSIFVNILDTEKIMMNICPSLKPLCKILNIECPKLCKNKS